MNDDKFVSDLYKLWMSLCKIAIYIMATVLVAATTYQACRLIWQWIVIS